MSYSTNSLIKKSSIPLIICATLFTSGCTLDNKVEKQLSDQEKEINETVEKNALADEEYQKLIEENRYDERKKNHEDNYVMTERQKEFLKRAESQTAEEAVKQNSLDKAVVLSKKVPPVKEKYIDRNEAALFFSYILFQYHSSQIDGKKFYQKIKPYMHPQFEDKLPSKTEQREDMFSTIQKLFTEQLSGPITNYEVTEVFYKENSDEAFFYRKYTLKEGDPIYYKTTIALGKNKEWLLVDDEPTVGYEIENTHISTTFNNQFIEGKGE